MADYQVINGIRVRQEGIGKKTGRITQIGPEFSMFSGRTKQGWAIRYWFAVYECECGERHVRRTGYGGESCGCLAIEKFKEVIHLGQQFATVHGMTDTRTHKSWSCMIGRCTQPSHIEYHRYGARGITICDRWREFRNFYEDMGERPEGCSIDRIDPDGNYEPGNCRWATASQQARNRRNTVSLTIDGVTKPLCDWADEAGIKYATVYARLKYGYSPKDAVFAEGQLKR